MRVQVPPVLKRIMYPVSNVLIYVRTMACWLFINRGLLIEYGIEAVKNGYFDNLSRYIENESSILFVPIRVCWYIGNTITRSSFSQSHSILMIFDALWYGHCAVFIFLENFNIYPIMNQK